MQEAGVCGLAADRDVIADMRRRGIALSYQNYAVWRAYLAAANSGLTRAIDIVLSNRRALDAHALTRLYERFCPEADPIASLDLVSRNALTRTNQLAGLLGAAGTTLPDDHLAGLAQELSELSQLGRRLAQRLMLSEERIGELERCLSDARLEASTDGLTGVANRRAFEQALRTAAASTMNTGEELAFVLADIDHFKAVNDRWGHSVGDDMLRMVAQVLTRTVRGRDQVARYGGEEFAIILPRTSRQGAMAVAENLRQAVRQQRLKLMAPRPLEAPAEAARPARGESIGVTVSLGVSCYDIGENLEGWMARADAALYEAKRSGRDRSAFGAPGIVLEQKPGAGKTARGRTEETAVVS